MKIETGRLLAMNKLKLDRRCDPRRPAHGDVVLSFLQEAKEIIVSGTLVDLSDRGLRLRHESAKLKSGQKITVSYLGRKSEAKVVWTAIFDGYVESGLMLLSTQQDPVR